ncbi:MAG: carbohydrate-binding domain-containing protein, partial [Solobacterium sp.]|nr:carbohydrate-binding domain-containing protein [Solobacterium sp.]
MSTHKNIDKICVAAILLALIITVLFMNGENLGLKKTVDTDAERYSATEYFTSNDLNSGTIDFSDAVKITLKEDSASVSGNGAYVWDGVVTIVRSGYYTVSGTGQNLRIVVDAEEYSKVWIELNGVTMTCEDDACLQIEEADKVFVVLAEGTENSLQSGAAYSDSAVAAGHDAALFSREDLTITGSGSLAVTSEYRHGIAGNDDLVITGGTISVTAAKDGLHANDSIRICNADLRINAEEEGIQTDEENSWLYIESGKLDITSTDDSIKSAGDITIAGGDITISSGDDGIRSDTKVTIRSGTILINTCYEGIEAKIVEIHDGDITIYPEDDGINANGGSAGMNPGMFNP